MPHPAVVREPDARPENLTLFFALKPPPEEASRIAQTGSVIGKAHHLEGHWMRSDLVHLTLAACHQGREGLEGAIARATAVGDGLRYKPFHVHLDRTCSYNHGSGHFPFVLCGADELQEVIAFRALLRSRLRRAGFAVPSGFSPHVTLVWADRIIAPHPLLPVSWLAEELLLVVSHVGQSRHTHVARWPLR